LARIEESFPFESIRRQGVNGPSLPHCDGRAVEIVAGRLIPTQMTFDGTRRDDAVQSLTEYATGPPHKSEDAKNGTTNAKAH
jgi:predicted subunit of tRNA(5-methylaminomethyl-2-thiouridylate) methyltransferase